MNWEKMFKRNDEQAKGRAQEVLRLLYENVVAVLVIVHFLHEFDG